MRLNKIPVWICLLVVIEGCSINNKVLDNPIIFEKKYFQVPAGVDSTIAYNSRIKAERLFVNTKDEQAADSLNKYFSEYLKITEELYNSLEAKKQEFKKIRQSYKELTENNKDQNTLPLEVRKNYEALFQGMAEDSLTISIVTSLLDYYLDYCQENFEQAYKINRFDLNGLINLGTCNWDRGVIFKDTQSYRKAIEFLMKFLSYNRGVAFIYKDIGKNYFEAKEWEPAYHYFFKAREIYVLTSVFEDQKPTVTGKYQGIKLPANVDPAKYFEYIYWKGRAEIYTYRADSALVTFKDALALAPAQKDSIEINYWVKEWIKWDDGNIYGAEQRFIIQDSLFRGQYEWAKNAYLRLLPQLKTKKARDDITWRLARIEHEILNQKEEAATRLYNLVVSADTSKVKGNIYKAPQDSIYKVYFKDCGDVLFGLGNHYKDQGLYDKARLYFSRDTTFEWSGRGKAFLPLVQMVTFEIPENMAPAERLKLANDKRLKLLNRAKMFISDFTDIEIDMLYRPLILIYQQQRDTKNAELSHREWLGIKERLKKKL